MATPKTNPKLNMFLMWCFECCILCQFKNIEELLRATLQPSFLHFLIANVRANLKKHVDSWHVRVHLLSTEARRRRQYFKTHQLFALLDFGNLRESIPHVLLRTPAYREFSS